MQAISDEIGLSKKYKRNMPNEVVKHDRDSDIWFPVNLLTFCQKKIAGIAANPTKIQVVCWMFASAGVLTAIAAMNVPKMMYPRPKKK